MKGRVEMRRYGWTAIMNGTVRLQLGLEPSPPKIWLKVDGKHCIIWPLTDCTERRWQEEEKNRIYRR
ncbi:hypothetical protein PAXRUDRAFT_645427 [Paxillus rubicundulus Ve08.2h10]|uniref:Uncharacterized protein n=1 Tax=Paxillus rubicundulus Ve08.2h10 TaxID=930991 RepID=A0A0D0E6M9_9AGAM|nr:hypothetical protein PAXRUDRAFT_645427 [Paxillus rubicundulus Ve08.2h10]